MNTHPSKRIYQRCNAKNFKPRHVAEVGVYLPETSNVINFIQAGVKTTLVEADPNTVMAIQQYFSRYPNVYIFPVAVFDYNGEIELLRRAASTFISTLPASPSLVNDGYQAADEDKFTVPCKKFSEIDPGDLDLLSIDIEGAEWYVLKHMVSRPKVLSIETHGKFYVNPNLGQIETWLSTNGYQRWYMDKSDTVYVHKNTFSVSLSEKIALFWWEKYVQLRRWKKVFYRTPKGT
jgi:FkbM family methyltransferase